MVNNGAYSSRAVEICEYYGLPFIDLKFPIDARPSLEVIERTLKENEDIALVYTTHNETGTGILNPVREIGALVHQYHAVFVVDTTSTYAMRPINIKEDNIDFCMASAQKGLMAMTGVSFVVGKEVSSNSQKIIRNAPITATCICNMIISKNMEKCTLLRRYRLFMQCGRR